MKDFPGFLKEKVADYAGRIAFFLSVVCSWQLNFVAKLARTRCGDDKLVNVFIQLNS